ncbi:putative membrane protein [Klebsiella pneumoniae JHCK1]|nr:putative membrane protein [Klebsiella pneumoniae JHCK1]
MVTNLILNCIILPTCLLSLINQHCFLMKELIKPLF